MDMLAYIAQLIGGLSLMLLGSIMAGVSTLVEENSPWKGLLCILVAIPVCIMGIFFTVIALRSIFNL